ncbi:hypothetical protein [Streptomyces aureus]
MTGADVANIAVVIGLFALAAVVYRVCFRPPATRITAMPAELTPAEEEQFLAEVTDLADLDTHLDDCARSLARFYEPGALTLQHPGFARLLAAVRDEQQKETR